MSSTYSQMVQKNVICHETKNRERVGAEGRLIKHYEKKCKQLVNLVKNVYQIPLHYFYNFFASFKLYQNYIQRKVQSTGGRYNNKSSLQEVKRMR